MDIAISKHKFKLTLDIEGAKGILKQTAFELRKEYFVLTHS